MTHGMPDGKEHVEVVIKPLPLTEDQGLYDASYFTERSYGLDPQRARAYAQEQRRLWLHAKKPGRILDIGCGLGDFLAGMDDRWQKFGVEPSRYAARLAAKKGIRVMRDSFDLDDASMDVVVFRGTLQHIADPITSLTEAARVLKPGGLLAILATPDADSIAYHLFRTLPALEVKRNWIVFGALNLTDILRHRLGFKDIEVTHPYLFTPYARPLRDFWNFLRSLFFGYRPFAFPGNMMEIWAVKQ